MQRQHLEIIELALLHLLENLPELRSKAKDGLIRFNGRDYPFPLSHLIQNAINASANEAFTIAKIKNAQRQLRERYCPIKLVELYQAIEEIPVIA